MSPPAVFIIKKSLAAGLAVVKLRNYRTAPATTGAVAYRDNIYYYPKWIKVMFLQLV